MEGTTLKLSVSIRLNDGVTDAGATKTVSISLGTLDVNAWDQSKAIAIIRALRPCLSKPIYSVIGTEQTSINVNAA